jgi:hypothetical protein
MTGAEFAYMLLAAAVVVACLLVIILVVDRDRDTRPDVGLSIFRSNRDDATEAEVLALPEAIRIARSPFADWTGRAERAGQFAEALTEAQQRIERRRGPGRHRAYGPRGRAMLARLQFTREFDAIAAGHPVVEHGPVEIVSTRHEQLPLPLRGLPPRVGEVRHAG